MKMYEVTKVGDPYFGKIGFLSWVRSQEGDTCWCHLVIEGNKINGYWDYELTEVKIYELPRL